jgi:hypothetical protein
MWKSSCNFFFQLIRAVIQLFTISCGLGRRIIIIYIHKCTNENCLQKVQETLKKYQCWIIKIFFARGGISENECNLPGLSDISIHVLCTKHDRKVEYQKAAPILHSFKLHSKMTWFSSARSRLEKNKQSTVCYATES